MGKRIFQHPARWFIQSVVNIDRYLTSEVGGIIGEISETTVTAMSRTQAAGSRGRDRWHDMMVVIPTGAVGNAMNHLCAHAIFVFFCAALFLLHVGPPL